MLNEFKQDTIQDLIRKSRYPETNIKTFISKAINDIKKELQDKDKNIKITATIKLIFLYINYYEIEWASFTTLEVLSTSGTTGKLYGYLIASLQIKNENDYLQLIPNQIKNDLKKENYNNINSTLTFLNNVMNLPLACELLKNIESLLNLNNKLIRKKTIICLTKCCEKFAINNDFTYWEDYYIKLLYLLNDDSKNNLIKNQGAEICIISSIQRMCYISPEHVINGFVELMNYFLKCDINWNLIKIIDIFNLLFKYEPKFTKKKEFIKILSEQLMKIKSKSVEIALVKLIITNFNPENNKNCIEITQASEEKLKSLLDSSDNNLLILSIKILENLTLTKKNYITAVYKIVDNNNENPYIIKECLKFLSDEKVIDKNNYKEIIEKIISVENILQDSVINCIEKIFVKNNFAILSNDKQNILWFIDIVFDIAYKQFTKANYDNENKISNIIKLLIQNTNNINTEINNKCLEYLNKCLSNENQIKKNNTSDEVNFVIMSTSQEYYN